ncbi:MULTISPECIES: glycerate kinase [unclassified Listeria]|uniref:glycerate kinase family protein n=1 Tax=unclassified Listeria TaxID=2642072 RepID=UPI000B58E106|nr:MULTISPECIES: glycerate kinase [unclassified Listeria]
MKIAIAVDSFKGSLTSLEAGEAIQKGIHQIDASTDIQVYEVSDGGEGSMSALKHGLEHVESVTMIATDTLNRAREVSYLITTWENKKTAIIESASIIGIEAIKPSEETTKQGSSFGVGEMILDAKARNCKQIVIFLGGTATSDGGLGLLTALTKGNKHEGNLLLQEAKFDIDLHALKETFAELEIFIGSDVSNPFSGELGFAHVFAPQKGASLEQVKRLDARAKDWANFIFEQVGTDLNELAGTGAAGGIAGSLVCIGGKIESGFDLIAAMTNLEAALKTADLIYTGEGSIDQQSAQGKLPMKIAEIARKYAIPVIGLAGRRSANLGDLEALLLGVFSIQQEPISLDSALKKEVAAKNLALTARESYQLFKYIPKN